MQEQLRNYAQRVDQFLIQYFAQKNAEDEVLVYLRPPISHSKPAAVPPVPDSLSTLQDSVSYSLLQAGAKRFRPALAMMTSEALGFSAEQVLPLAASLECIHTYSLIHDDLPVMDNDDFRRGLPTNHRVYGDATALLAGDALQAEAFQIIAKSYQHEPQVALQVIAMLSHAIGLWGMVGGQAVDLLAQKNADLKDDVLFMHRLKTGALIQASVVASAKLCFANPEQTDQLTSYAQGLGLAFQVADDLLDYDPEHPEAASYATILGPNKAQDYLHALTNECLAILNGWPERAGNLRELATYNASRTH